MSNTLTGILEWPSSPNSPRLGRVRQVADSTIIASPDDPVVPIEWGDRYHLRAGLQVTVELGSRTVTAPQQRITKPDHRDGPRGSVQAPLAQRLLGIEGEDAQTFTDRKQTPFEDLTVIDPAPRLQLEYPGCPASCRLIDLFCPIGRGQRGLIVSPPKAGKTTLLKDIALSILRNHRDVDLFMLLVDERPEEVTDFSRTITKAGEEFPGGTPERPRRARVIASSNDHGVERHITVSTLTIDRCKRLVEQGRHVVVLLDSLTRLGRAFNSSNQHATGGRTLTGGIDSKALEVPKTIFGSARNTEIVTPDGPVKGGSLTIIATCLVDTGSAMDQVIFEEFKGTGNMELILDRKVAERRLFPAMDLAASGTRKEDLLLSAAEVKTMTALRRNLLAMPPHQQIERLLAAMDKFKTNAQLVGG